MARLTEISPPFGEANPIKPARAGAARLRILLTYVWRHGRVPNLVSPTSFNELVQVRKLVDRDPMMPIWADKIKAKALVADRLGAEWVIPLLWSGDELPVCFSRDRSVVVKSRHGCKQIAIIHNAARDWEPARLASTKWMRGHYGGWLDEWLYREIPRGLLVEPFIGANQKLPLDYKVFVFGGRATHVQVHIDRATNHQWIVHDRDWQRIAKGAPAVARPSALEAMLAAAEVLGKGFEFVRVDFYQPGHQPLFGEMTFYPGSGLDPFDPPALDQEFGQLWLAAKQAHR